MSAVSSAAATATTLGTNTAGYQSSVVAGASDATETTTVSSGAGKVWGGMGAGVLAFAMALF